MVNRVGVCRGYRLSMIPKCLRAVRNLGAASRRAACLKQPSSVFGGGEGRIAWEKEKPPEFAHQKQIKILLCVSGRGGINTAVRDRCLGTASTSRLAFLASPSQRGFRLASW